MDKKYYKMLEEIAKACIDKAKEDEEFAKLLNDIMERYYISVITEKTNVQVQKPKKKPTRIKTPAVLNPLEIAQDDENELKNQLMDLELSQLKDIIRDYDLDPLKLTSSWRKKERIVDHILEVVHVRINEGKGFRGN